MTQAEYEAQAGTQRAPRGSVVVQDFHSWSQTSMFAGREIETRYYWVRSCGELFQYRTHPNYNDGILYTMDEDGNCKAPSVFREPCTEAKT
jgi:hypothetical protein